VISGTISWPLLLPIDHGCVRVQENTCSWNMVKRESAAGSGKGKFPELPAGVDAELAEDAAQVGFDRARAEVEPRADLARSRPGGDQSCDVQFMGRELIGRLGGALARVLTGGAEFACGARGERRGAHVGQHSIRGAQLVPGLLPPPLAAQPLAVDEVSTGCL